MFLAAKRLDLDDPIIGEMEQQFANPDIAAGRRAQFGFALAKAMEDAKAYDRVFTYLRPANDLMRDAFPYDLERRKAHEQKMMESYRSLDWTSAPLNTKSDYAPIFVTGMPRSGTTLVEQIIASHSTVTGCGEVGVAAKQVIKTLADEEGRIRPSAALAQTEFETLADWYQGYIEALFPGSGRITDKEIFDVARQ